MNKYLFEVPVFHSPVYIPETMPCILCSIYFTTMKKLKKKRQSDMCEGTGGETGWEGSWIMRGLVCLAEELGFYFESRNHGADFA